jgi:hypothetical protein
MVVAQQVPQQRPLNPLRRSHRQWVVQVLTISKLKRWSINYTCGKVIARFDGHIAVYLGDGLLVYLAIPLLMKMMRNGLCARGWASWRRSGSLTPASPKGMACR